MDQSLNDNETVSERLRHLIESTYPQRGRFGELEEVSEIGANRWKNFYYRKQNATREMLQFWCQKYPSDANWLINASESPEQDDFPFSARVPTSWPGQTVGDRLNWVISEWAAGSGETLFKYLEEKSSGEIPASEWAKVVLRTAEPTLPMVTLVCDIRPHFSEWVIRGSSSRTPQVDPTDKESVLRWKTDKEHIWNQLEELLASTKKKNDA